MTSEESLIDEAKQTLDEISGEGYWLKQVRFEPRRGCRICPGKEDAHLTVIFVGKRIEEKKLFLYCMAKVCIPCLALGEAEETLAMLMTEAVP